VVVGVGKHILCRTGNGIMILKYHTYKNVLLYLEKCDFNYLIISNVSYTVHIVSISARPILFRELFQIYSLNYSSS